MPSRTVQSQAQTILVQEVDQLVNFADAAISDPGELAALGNIKRKDRILVDVVDQLLEFRDQAVNNPTDLQAVGLVNGTQEMRPKE